MLGGCPVSTAWRVLGLRMEERPPAMEGSRISSRGRASSSGVGRGADNPSP
jgi:hypothetical protein